MGKPVKSEVPIQVGMRGISIDEIDAGKQGYVLLPLGPLDPTIWGGRKLVRMRVTTMEKVRSWRDIIVGNEQKQIKEHTPVEISYELAAGGYQRVGEDYPFPITFSKLSKVVVAAGTAYIAGADIITTAMGGDLSPTNSPTTFRVMCCFSAATKLEVMYDDETTVSDMAFNSGTDLLADALYSFDIVVTSAYGINFKGDANSTIRIFIVIEVPGA